MSVHVTHSVQGGLLMFHHFHYSIAQDFLGNPVHNRIAKKVTVRTEAVISL